MADARPATTVAGVVRVVSVLSMGPVPVVSMIGSGGLCACDSFGTVHIPRLDPAPAGARSGGFPGVSGARPACLPSARQGPCQTSG